MLISIIRRTRDRDFSFLSQPATRGMSLSCTSRCSTFFALQSGYWGVYVKRLMPNPKAILALIAYASRTRRAKMGDWRDYQFHVRSNLLPLERAHSIKHWLSAMSVNNQLSPATLLKNCLLYTSPSPRDRQKSRMPSSA